VYTLLIIRDVAFPFIYLFIYLLKQQQMARRAGLKEPLTGC